MVAGFGILLLEDTTIVHQLEYILFTWRASEFFNLDVRNANNSFLLAGSTKEHSRQHLSRRLVRQQLG